jgi:hypothetical protein
MKTSKLVYTDLTQRPPRSPRVRLGGYAILARCLDKGRATLAGKNGEYHYACPLDMNWFRFAGIEPAALKKQLAAGLSDTEIVEWVARHSRTNPEPHEIAAWSAFQDTRGPQDVESREYFVGLLKKVSTTREDIVGWFDLLDADDFVSFGGKA